MALAGNDIFLGAFGIVSPLGPYFDINFNRVVEGDSGLKPVENAFDLGQTVHCGLTPQSHISDQGRGTHLDRMILGVFEQCHSQLHQGEIDHVIFCTTKGNIQLLEKNDLEGAHLWQLGETLKRNTNLNFTYSVVSHACISGINGIIQASALIKSGRAKNVMVIGADLCTRFTLSGFLCLQAVSRSVCSPYDQDRDGINLGEAVAGLVMSANATLFHQIKGAYLGGGMANDANHISGPSRTGEGLVRSINAAMAEAHTSSGHISTISAHGTATVFNDEMESIAFNRTNLGHVPTHSLKPHFGHTLGAAGVVETMISLEALRHGLALGNLKLKQQGVSFAMNLPTSHQKVDRGLLLKTGSGFGGCNSAVIIKPHFEP